MARKIQKNSKAKGLLNSSRDDPGQQTAGSNNRCLSLLKTKGDGIYALVYHINFVECVYYLGRTGNWVVLGLFQIISFLDSYYYISTSRPQTNLFKFP